MGVFSEEVSQLERGAKCEAPAPPSSWGFQFQKG